MKSILILLMIIPHFISQSTKIVFDIPALKSKTIIQIRALLGKPKIDDVPLNYKTNTGALGDAYFEKNGFTLEVTYNPTNNKVNDFFLGKDHAISDYKILEIAGNLVDTKDFLIDPVKFSKNQALYTGITITQK
jgi:hypothetical protein